MKGRFSFVRAAFATILGAASFVLVAGAAEPGPPGASDHTLRLAEFAFDPAQGPPALPEGWSHSLQSMPDLHLVQFDGPIPGNALERLRADGLEPVQYVFPDTYITWGRGSECA